LDECGIEHNSCIDKTLIETIIGCQLNVDKDKNQRHECGCMESIDIGTYDTCKNGCKYCYANHSEESVIRNCNKYDVNSPILCGLIDEKEQALETLNSNVNIPNKELPTMQEGLAKCKTPSEKVAFLNSGKYKRN